MDNRVEGRTAIVTGAGNGLGRAIARRLAAAGASVVCVGRDVGRLEHTVEQIAAAGGRAKHVRCDVTSATEVTALHASLLSSEVSILVNNAGVAGPVSELIAIEPDDWDAVFIGNVRSVFLMCRAFAPEMCSRGDGDIINIGSVAGARPLAARSPYCASKAAVRSLSDTLSFELGSHGVRVNTLSPGPVNGERMDRNFRLEADRLQISIEAATKNYVNRASAARMVTEEEVADAVLAMLSMTGLHAANIDLSAGMVGR